MRIDFFTRPDAVRAGLATMGIVLASVGFGLVPYFARSLTGEGMAPQSIAFFRYAIAATLLVPLMWRARRQWRVLAWGMVAGAAMGLGWIGYVRAVDIAPVSTVGVLYMTYPVFTLLIAWLGFGDRPGRRAIAAALMIVLAAALASSRAAVSVAHLPALVLSLAAPLGFGFGINVLVHKLPSLPPLARIGTVSFGSMVVLAPLVVATPVAAVLPASAHGWWLVAGIAVGSALLPQLLFTVCAPVIGTARTAVAGSIELPTMFLIGWAVYHEAIGPPQWFACAIVIAAIALTPGRGAVRSMAATLPRQTRQDPASN